MNRGLWQLRLTLQYARVDSDPDTRYRICRVCHYTVVSMSVRIAIPEPTSSDPAYNQRSLPPYLAALACAPARRRSSFRCTSAQERVAKLLAGVQGILLPGSRYDVDPQRYGEAPIPECGEADPARTAVDELLLQDAFNLHKPILAICHGTQTLECLAQRDRWFRT